MKRLVRRIEDMQKCHRDILSQIVKVEDSLAKFRKNDSVEEMKLTLDVFLLYMKTTVKKHKSSEEDVIFPFLRSIDYPEKVISNMIDDHEDIHRNVELLNILKEMDYEEKEDVEERVSDLLKRLKSHIKLEERILRKTKEMISREEKTGFRLK